MCDDTALFIWAERLTAFNRRYCTLFFADNLRKCNHNMYLTRRHFYVQTRTHRCQLHKCILRALCTSNETISRANVFYVINTSFDSLRFSIHFIRRFSLSIACVYEFTCSLSFRCFFHLFLSVVSKPVHFLFLRPSNTNKHFMSEFDAEPKYFNISTKAMRMSKQKHHVHTAQIINCVHLRYRF